MTTGANSHYTTDGKLSIKLVGTSATREHKLGTRATGNDGTVWIYVQCTAAIAKYDVVSFGTDYLAGPATATTAATGDKLGVAQNAFSADEFGWVCIEATKMSVAVSSSITANTQLYIATTAGKLSTTSSSGTLDGIWLMDSSATTGVTINTAIFVSPHYGVRP